MTDLDKIVAEAWSKAHPLKCSCNPGEACVDCKKIVARHAALAALEMAAVHLDGMAEDTDNLASDHNDDGDQVLACTLAGDARVLEQAARAIRALKEDK